MRDWRVDGGLYKCPKKPLGYDLWKQEEDALIKAAGPIPCKGGDLIPIWVTVST